MGVIVVAVDVPDVQVPAALLSLEASETLPSGNAPVSRVFSQGDTLTVRTKLNRNASALDLAGRYGGGGYAVAAGLDLSVPASGLSLEIAAGHAVIDGVVEVAEATTATATASVRTWIWLRQNGTITPVPTSTAPPAGACCLLGSCLADGSDILSVDTSGVLYLRGGMLWRESADPSVPSDTPPAGIVFLHKTAGGLWLWDGTAYRALAAQADEFAAITGSKSDANYTLPAAEYRCRLLRLGWTGWTGAHDAVLPLTLGAWWWVINATGQAATMIGATGTGTAIANGKAAAVWCDGTNINRLTADA